MAASIAASLCTPAWATMDVTTSADGIAGEDKDITVGVSGVDASDEIVYGTTIVWEDPTFTYTVDGGASTRWDPETHTYKAGNGSISGAFDKNSVGIKVYNHSNAKIDASCFVGASANATTTSYAVSGYDVTLAVSNPDGNAATLPAPEPNSALDAVSTLFTLGISGTGMTKYASDLIASASNGSKLGVVVLNLGKHREPAPVMAPQNTWYKFEDTYLELPSTITKITFVDTYEPTGNETKYWDASAAEDGSVMCYKNGTELTIAGNGSGSIAANPDSSYMFSSTEYGYYFGSVKEILGLELLDTTNVTTMCGMFYECTLLDGLDVSSFNTANVTDISSMFSSCKSLSSLDVLNFDTSQVTNMSWLFGECWALESLDLTGWDTSKVTNMYAMFKNCYSLPEIDVTGFDTSNVTTMYIMFRGCHSLTTLDLTSFETSKVIDMGGMFQECYKLTTIYVTTGLWDMTNVKYSSSMYKDSTKLKGDKGGKLTYMTV